MLKIPSKQTSKAKQDLNYEPKDTEIKFEESDTILYSSDTHKDSTIKCFDSEDDAIDEDECETETILQLFRDV